MDQAADLDFDLGAFLPYRLNRAAELVSRRFAAQYKARYQMTRPEWRTLAALGACGRMTATEIAAHSSMHKTKVSRAVRALEERRWLKRTEDANDRRTEHLELTALGLRKYREMARLAKAYAQELAALLGEKAVRHLHLGLGAVEKAMIKPGGARDDHRRQA
ncbi:MarR family winged helix-turn-helix transcriptional regulator [Chelativorans sp. AA-79]|uniref:MarR family winged helix-turn-helix transcriptional regulator n=1 Tax=Chelativorans sp. AA-79 TaxID=3028735 RepID=UPI0023F68CA0|nr:MarR family winged helix-turn-helix transcriptional regulator [Chelativorans sp. AA-79]WEX10502.1 MarR family winged helix-turn-helix transcriptional regulator [Chelativorans sp. AA-79]